MKQKKNSSIKGRERSENREPRMRNKIAINREPTMVLANIKDKQNHIEAKKGGGGSGSGDRREGKIPNA